MTRVTKNSASPYDTVNTQNKNANRKEPHSNFFLEFNQKAK